MPVVSIVTLCEWFYMHINWRNVCPSCPREPWICLNEDTLYIYHGYFCISKKHCIPAKLLSLTSVIYVYKLYNNTVYILYNYCSVM